jgi:hypothetical protein
MTHYRFASTFIRGSDEKLKVADGAAPVAKPPRADQCWGLTRLSKSPENRDHARCRARARGAGGPAAKLTCQSHRALEPAARELLATVSDAAE